jgi:cysteinyl-tRNA synthetase
MVPGPPSDPTPRRNFARFWVHGRHLLVDGRKMSKRDGTFFTVRDLLDPVAAGRADLRERLLAAGFPEGAIAAPVLRLALIWGHYRQSLNFSFDVLTQARNAVARLQSLYDRAFELGATPGAAGKPASPAVTAAIAAGLAAFDEALGNDLDLERGMTIVLDLVSQLNVLPLQPADGPAVAEALANVDQILDVLVRRRMALVDKDRIARYADSAFLAEQSRALPAAYQASPDRAALVTALAGGQLPSLDAITAIEGDLDDALIELLIACRQAAKKARDFAAADAARAHLRARGIIIEDLATGVRWKSV